MRVRVYSAGDGYYLPENKRTYLPVAFVFVDTETVAEEALLRKRTREGKEVPGKLQRLRLGFAEVWVKKKLKRRPRKESFPIAPGLYYVKADAFFFRTEREFWERVVAKFGRKGGRIWIIAWNASFDFRVLYSRSLFEWLGLEVRKHIIDSNRFAVFIKAGKATLVFADGMHWYGRRPLAQIAETFGLRKLDTLKKYGLRVDEVPEEELKRYVAEDVKILRVAVLEFARFIYGKASWKLTIAGVAFSWWRHNYLPRLERKPVRVRDEEYLEWVRKAYYGGRTEAFVVKRPVRCAGYDVNSMYPYVMVRFRYPLRLRTVYVAESEEDAEKLAKLAERMLKNPKKFIIAEADVHVPESLPVGVLPYRTKDKVLFVTGRVRGVYSTPDFLSVLLAGGRIRRVWKLAVYEAGELFRGYVEEFYRMKKEAKERGDRVRYFIAKIFLNSLYGKFGQREEVVERAEEYDYMLPDGVWKTNLGEMFVLGGRCWVRTRTEKFSKLSMPEIALAVTAWARFHLFALIYNIIMSGGQVYYCDTDSLFVDEKGEEILIKTRAVGDKLGQVKVEKDWGTYAFYAPKFYKHIESGKIKCKGIPKKAKMRETEEALEGEFERAVGFRESARWFADGERIPVFFATVRRVAKKVYEKGIVLPEGWVRPFRVRDW